MTKKEMSFLPLFACPLMEVHLDLDLEKLTEFAFDMWGKDKKGIQATNQGGWHSNCILKEKHEEFIKLKKEISQHIQTYHLEVFRGMKFKGNVIQNIDKMWVNINEKHHYNEWHIHPMSTLSGAYYIKHDQSREHGELVFKHPIGRSGWSLLHWPKKLIEEYNTTTAHTINITPEPNMLLLFPSWLEHKVEVNLKNNSRISLSFNTTTISLLEKKS